jgi:hypothetical protein
MPPQLRQDYEHIIMLCAGTGITPMLQLSRCHINQQRQLVRRSLFIAITQYLLSPVHVRMLLIHHRRCTVVYCAACFPTL